MKDLQMRRRDKNKGLIQYVKYAYFIVDIVPVLRSHFNKNILQHVKDKYETTTEICGCFVVDQKLSCKSFSTLLEIKMIRKSGRLSTIFLLRMFSLGVKVEVQILFAKGLGQHSFDDGSLLYSCSQPVCSLDSEVDQ